MNSSIVSLFLIVTPMAIEFGEIGHHDKRKFTEGFFLPPRRRGAGLKSPFSPILQAPGTIRAFVYGAH
jgi:hypothetical protein